MGEVILCAAACFHTACNYTGICVNLSHNHHYVKVVSLEYNLVIKKDVTELYLRCGYLLYGFGDALIFITGMNIHQNGQYKKEQTKGVRLIQPTSC